MMIVRSKALRVRLVVMNVDYYGFESKVNMMNYVCRALKSEAYMIMVDY